ncbi:MAG: thiamine pyrophosphate-dependent enzyme [Bilophila wadsworthia]
MRKRRLRRRSRSPAFRKTRGLRGDERPGHVHLINGLYDANRSYAPVIAIASHIPGSAIGTRYFQETHPDQLFNECSHCNELISSPSQMPHVLRRAMQTAVSKRGVSVIALPGNVAAMPMDEEPSHGVIRRLPPRQPTPMTSSSLPTKSTARAKVTFIAGPDAATPARKSWPSRTSSKAPIGHAWRGKQWIEPDNPFDVGMTGLIGFGGAYEAMEHCDLLILLGTDMPYSAWYPKKPRIVNSTSGASTSAADPHRPRGRRGRGPDPACPAPLRGTRETAGILTRPLPISRNPGTPQRLRRACFLRRQAASRASYVGHRRQRLRRSRLHRGYRTQRRYRAARYITAKVGRNIIGSFNHGSMACALPMSIGAQLLYPERQVIALCGDGGMTMLMGELLTLVQYNLPIKVIVYNNGALGFINLEMRTAGYPEFQTDMKNPDFARMAEVIGMKGFRIEKGADVEPVIKAALATPGPVLVDALTDPAAIPLPPTITAGEAKGTCPRPRQARPHGPFQRHDGYDQIEYQAILGEDWGGDLLEKGPLLNALLSPKTFNFIESLFRSFPVAQRRTSIYFNELSFYNPPMQLAVP